MLGWLLRRLVSRLGKSSAAPPAPYSICGCPGGAALVAGTPGGAALVAGTPGGGGCPC